jgi:hypothetical protein
VKTIALTLICNNKTSNQNRGFIQPPQLCQGGNLPTSVGGFYFGIFAPIGAIQHKEVAIAKAGTTLYCSNISFQFSIQDSIQRGVLS